MDFIERLAARRSARDEERSRINRRLLELNREAEEDEIALRVFQRVSEEASTFAEGNTPSQSFQSRFQQRPHTQQLRVKDAILAVLKDAPGGLTAKQIRGRAHLKFNLQVNPNTLTVTLERYKQKGLVAIEGREWFLVRNTPHQHSGASVINFSKAAAAGE